MVINLLKSCIGVADDGAFIEKFSGSVVMLQSNCSVVIPPDDNLVKTDEAIIVIMVFALWAWAIGLFIHRL